VWCEQTGGDDACAGSHPQLITCYLLFTPHLSQSSASHTMRISTAPISRQASVSCVVLSVLCVVAVVCVCVYGAGWGEWVGG
jgi:hypothetical protein